MSKFKVGDRVRRINDYFGGLAVGDVATVLNCEGNDTKLVDYVGWNFSTDNFELVTPAFTLTPGKFYRTASGAVTGRVSRGDIGFEAVVDGRMRLFDAGGGDLHGGDDIVEEYGPVINDPMPWTDLPAGAGELKFKVGDRITGEATGFGLVSGEIVEIDYSSHRDPYRIVDDATDLIIWVERDAVAFGERYPVDGKPSTTFSISLDTGNFHEELDEIIAKLKKIKKLQRAVGLAA